jgi:hypothetical protein
MSTAQRQARRLPIPAAWPVRSRPAAHPRAIISAGLAPSLLTGAYLTAGILQPASYSPVRTTISAMAGQAGTDRWVMTGGIFLVGSCYLVTAVRPRLGLAIGGSGSVRVGHRAGQGPRPQAEPVMAARLEVPRAGVLPVTVAAPARRAGLATIGAGTGRRATSAASRPP